MKFECGDLERAFKNPDLLPEARAHLSECRACREEYKLWTEISSAARELHEEWETPDLWGRIREGLETEARAKRKPALREWRWWAVAAAAILMAVASVAILRQAQRIAPRGIVAAGVKTDQYFLTEQALADVEKSETAYRKSIDRLAHLAEPKLANGNSAEAANARERLLLLDEAIDDTRTNVASNRFNIQLQTALAQLYREKEQTLKDLVTSDKAN